MYILIGIIFIIVSIVMLISPGTIFQISESWKGRYEQEPSDLYCASTRVAGAFFLIVGLASVIILLLN